MSDEQAPVIRIIHFNDVYNIDVAPTEPIGGASRFVTAVRQARQSAPGHSLVLFSGDAFSPAPLTPLTLGSEIPPILNALHIHVACIGNHELDNGLHVMKQRISETNFPWVMSNVFEISPTDTQSHTKVPLGGVHYTHCLTIAGFKFGFLGLASYEWLSSLDNIDLDGLHYVDYCEAATKVSHQLRYDQACDFVIALTHMRDPEDQLLAAHAHHIDLILGGHDHILTKKYINGIWSVKSGTDFKNFSTIDLQVTADRKLRVEEPVHYAVTSEYMEDPHIASFVAEKKKMLGNMHLISLATSATDLDGRFVAIRTKETGLGNFVCDVMTHQMNAKIGLINAGSFRSDCLEPAGLVTQQTIDAILPFRDQVVLVRCTGRHLLAILENSVSQYPMLVGRFCQVSGLSFSFDPNMCAGKRIHKGSVRCKNEKDEMVPLDEDFVYRCSMKTYTHNGKEGFPEGDEKDILTRSKMPLKEMVSVYLGQFSDPDDPVKLPVISPSVEGRIRCTNPDPELLKQYES